MMEILLCHPDGRPLESSGLFQDARSCRNFHATNLVPPGTLTLSSTASIQFFSGLNCVSPLTNGMVAVDATRTLSFRPETYGVLTVGASGPFSASPSAFSVSAQARVQAPRSLPGGPCVAIDLQAVVPGTSTNLSGGPATLLVSVTGPGSNFVYPTSGCPSGGAQSITVQMDGGTAQVFAPLQLNSQSTFTVSTPGSDPTVFPTHSFTLLCDGAGGCSCSTTQGACRP